MPFEGDQFLLPFGNTLPTLNQLGWNPESSPKKEKRFILKEDEFDIDPNNPDGDVYKKIRTSSNS